MTIYYLSKQPSLGGVRILVQVGVGKRCNLAAAGGALDEAFLDEERLVDFLHGFCILAEGGGDGGESNRAAVELVDNREQ